MKTTATMMTPLFSFSLYFVVKILLEYPNISPVSFDSHSNRTHTFTHSLTQLKFFFKINKKSNRRKKKPQRKILIQFSYSQLEKRKFLLFSFFHFLSVPVAFRFEIPFITCLLAAVAFDRIRVDNHRNRVHGSIPCRPEVDIDCHDNRSLVECRLNRSDSMDLVANNAADSLVAGIWWNENQILDFSGFSNNGFRNEFGLCVQ